MTCFFTKLPYPWCDIIFSKWKGTERPEWTDTLEGRIEFARMTLAHECEKAYKRRKLQKDHKKLRCKDQLYYPSKFGYDTKPPKPKKNSKRRSGKVKSSRKKRSPLNHRNPHRLRKNGSFLKRRKTKQPNQRPNKFRNRIVGVGTAMKKDILQTSVWSKLTL